MEAQRMDRRLAKLIAIHFAPISDVEKSSASSPKKGFGSAFLDLDLDELKRDPRSVISKGGSDLWTSFRARGRGEDPAIRQAEQSIVNWQDDDQVKACPICAMPFSFTVRKHHCRLCGRVVCASPHLTRLAWAEQMGPGTGKILTPENALLSTASVLATSLLIPSAVGSRRSKKELPPLPRLALALHSQGCPCLPRLQGDRTQAAVHDGRRAAAGLHEALRSAHARAKGDRAVTARVSGDGSGPAKHDQTAALGSSIRANIELQRDAVQGAQTAACQLCTYDELAKRIGHCRRGTRTAQSQVEAMQRRNESNMPSSPRKSLPAAEHVAAAKPSQTGSKKTTPGDAGSDTTGSAPGSPQPASPRLAPRRSTQHANKGSVSSIASFRSLFRRRQRKRLWLSSRQLTSRLDEQLNADDEAADDHLANATPPSSRNSSKCCWNRRSWWPTTSRARQGSQV